ncbi:MAG: ATP-binding protein [Actinomycetota bacterium]|nr:ATP-binding protein [Actinomycetota bacterium]
MLAGGATTLAVAAVVGPPLFHEHLERAGMGDHPEGLLHAEEAYRYATVIAIGVAVGVAGLTAMVVTAYFSRRLQRSVAELSAAATAVARGQFDSRVSPPRLGGEFADLADAFNRMARRLDTVDTDRRQMFADLAHEIRTPVSVLDAYTEAIEDGVKELDPQTVAVLRDQTRRLVRFSADLAALAQAEEGRIAISPRWVEAGEVIDAALAAARDRYAGKGVTLAGADGGRLPQVRVDPQRIGQVLGNVLDNALRHTPSGGQVRLRAHADSDWLTIAVTDTGAGIGAEHLPRIFERFYRADAARDRQHGGAGIGLAIAKALTEAHGGSIVAASAGAGQGTTVTVTLPIGR